MFDGSYRFETGKLKLILDGLMNAGMPQYLSVLEYSYSRNIALVVSIIFEWIFMGGIEFNIVIIFLPISSNICFGCSKEPSH